MSWGRFCKEARRQKRVARRKTKDQADRNSAHRGEVEDAGEDARPRYNRPVGLLRLSLIAWMLPLSGCFLADRSSEVQLINHAGGTVRTDLGGDFIALDDGQSARIKAPGRTPEFSVTNQSGTRSTYVLSYPRGDQYRGSCQRLPLDTRCDLMSFQLEPSGEIYVVPPYSTRPVQPLPAQPDEFPLLPMVP
jgi:hypothetical protein